MSIAADSPAREQSRLVGLMLALVTLLVYLPVCFHDFIFFDDTGYVLDNHAVQAGLTWPGFKWAFAGWHASNWHPLTWLSHMLDCQLVGLNPGAQHFINALFHAANTILLFHLWRRLTGKLWPSAIIAALFAWHPLHVESVAWIAERKDVLSTLFGLLAVLAYVNYVKGSRWGYWWSLVLFALGLMAKPMLVTLPFVFLLLDYWPLERLRGAKIDFKIAAKLGWEKAPFFLLSVASCVVTFLAQRGEAVMALQDRSLGLRVENACIAYLDYIQKALWPVKLGIIYPLPAQYPGLHIALAIILLAAVTMLAIWCWRRSPWLLMGWLWFLGTLVPVIGLVQVGNQSMADRYFYWPSIGLFAAIVFEGADWVARNISLLAPARIITGLALAGCVAATELQLSYWKDTKTLFAHTLSVTGENPEALMMLGVAYQREGSANEALHYFQAALKLDDSLAIQTGDGSKRSLTAQVLLIQAQAAEQKGDRTRATSLYGEALQKDPNLVEAHNNLANLLDESGAPQEALAHYQSAVQLDSTSPLAHENLGTQLIKMDQVNEGMQEYHEAMRLQPDSPHPYYLMGKAYLRLGQDTNAIVQLRRALEIDEHDFQSLTFLARILATDQDPKIRDGNAAITFAEKANTLSGGNQPLVLDVLGMAYAGAGRFNEAQQAAGKALELAKVAQLPDLIATAQRHLQSYQAGQPCRDPLTNSSTAPQTH